MKLKNALKLATGVLASAGLLSSGAVDAQYSESHRNMFKGMIAHSLQNKGHSARRDNGRKQSPSGFSYPQGRSMLVYSGGRERAGWNTKAHSAGEGLYIMSNTGGEAKIAFAGTNLEPSDVSSLAHEVRNYPEAYLGASEHHDWALSLRSSGGGRTTWTDAVNLSGANTNYWPAKGDITEKTVPQGHPAVIWNYHWNGYRDARPFADRAAAGEFAETLNPPAWAAGMSEADFPEMVGITKAVSSLHNLQWTRRYYQFGHTDYDDMIFSDITIENTGGTTQEGVYVAIKNRFQHSWAQNWYEGAHSWHDLRGDRLPADDHPRSTMAPNYLSGGTWGVGASKPAGNPRGADLAAAGHAMMYNHDGEQVNARFAHNDWGDPLVKKLGWRRLITDQQWMNEGLMLQGDYFGVGVIDWQPPFNRVGGLDDETYVAPHDNPATPQDESAVQPASTTIWQWNSTQEFAQPDPSKDSDQIIYDQLTSLGHPAEPTDPDMYTEFMTFGPYTLNAGEKFKVVVAYIGASGAQADKYSDYKRYGRPFAFGWYNGYNGKGGSYVPFESRQSEIPEGENVLFDHFENAIQAYEWGYNVPEQPPSIRGAFDSNLDGQNVVRWSGHLLNAADPDYTGDEANDIVGYRLYRSTVENQGPFELVAEVSIADAEAGVLPANMTYDAGGVFTTVKNSNFPDGIPLMSNPLVSGVDAAAGSPVTGLYKWTDTDSKAGFSNYYFVRTFDSGHDDWNGTGMAVPSLESAPGPGGAAQMGRTGGVVPQVPSDAIFDRFEANVAVVPNPYRIDSSTHSYSGQQNIRFINLPGRCQLDVYDVTGQRIWTQFKDDVTTGEMKYYQYSENRPSNFGQAVFPGIYYWKVTSLMPQSMNQTQTGTFLIVK